MAMLAAAATAAASTAVCVPASSATDLVVEVPADIVSMFGDVNADAKIGISDAVQLQRFLLGQDGDLGSWKNADLITDDTIDVFDFIKLRKVLTGEEQPEGAKLTIKVVDMMTGEPIDGATVTLHSEYDFEEATHLFTLGDWITGDEEINLFGLPTDEAYNSLLEVENLPEGYGNTFGCWSGNVEFSFGAGEEDKEYIVRVLSDDTECNLNVSFFDWTKNDSQIGLGTLEITDKEGNVYYPSLYVEDFALPDGEYHAEFKLFDNPMQFLDPDGEFADELKELFPDEEFRDCSSGIDFTVKDGKLDKDLRIDLGPKEGLSNSVNVTCYDMYTKQPIEGAKLSLIQFPDDEAKVVKEWTSSADGGELIDGLNFTGGHAYKVKVDSAPEGYTGTGEEYLGWGYLYSFTQEISFYFTPDTEEKPIIVNIRNQDEECALFNDLCPIEIYEINGPADIEKIAGGITAGEGFALPDGDYYAAIDSVVARAKGYCSTGLLGMTKFTVKDGKTDAPVDILVMKDSYGPLAGLGDLGDLEDILGGLGDLEGLEDLF